MIEQDGSQSGGGAPVYKVARGPKLLRDGPGYSCVYNLSSIAHSSHGTVSFLIISPVHVGCMSYRHQVYSLPFYAHNFSDCVLASEQHQKASDLHRLQSLNASCVNSDGRLKLLLW